MEFDVILLNDLDVPLLEEWMSYGALHGMGQWRNSGKGRFTVDEMKAYNVVGGFVTPNCKVEYVDE